MTHFLDSSAFFAFFFGEPGGRRVEELFQDPSVSVGLSAVSAVEFWARLNAEGREDVFDREWEQILPLFEFVVAADAAVCRKAVELRCGAAGRLPTVDAIIAASAAVNGAALVHRDPHFTAIPSELLNQELLPGE
jgi:predicted nucleic acid-binding protein